VSIYFGRMVGRQGIFPCDLLVVVILARNRLWIKQRYFCFLWLSCG